MNRAEQDVQALINLTCVKPKGPVTLKDGQGVVNGQEFGEAFARLLQQRDDKIRKLERDLQDSQRAWSSKYGELLKLLGGQNPGETLKQWRRRLQRIVTGAAP